MRLLSPEPGKGGTTVALFGAGLIGSSIAEHLRRLGPSRSTTLPYDWGSPDRQAEQVDDIVRRLASGDHDSDVAVVWAAGSAGFELDEAGSAAELASYGRVIRAAQRIAEARSSDVAFHLVSSAGGLYEGQRLISPATEPRPSRAYGRMKMAQEEQLSGASGLAPRVYRPTSIYGPVRETSRLGLIPTLVRNGLRQSVTIVVGHQDTLRDYVLVDDVGRYIAQDMIWSDTDSVVPRILASGRPVSLREVVADVENVIRRRLLVSIGAATNASDITFRPDAAPPDFETTDLIAGIRRVHGRYLEDGGRVAREF